MAGARQSKVSTWVIGDLQGAFEPLTRLVAELDFDPERDRLIFAGDLVNRGPDSAEILRWCLAQGDAVTGVLGNHDIHLLACDRDESQVRTKDTITDVLASPDREALIRWLAALPLWIDALDHVIVHAAVHPHWTFDEGRAIARETEAALRGPDGDAIFATWRTGTGRWEPSGSPVQRATSALAILTRMRCVTAEQTQDFTWSGPLDGRTDGLEPWFRSRDYDATDPTICFGHWARLGHHIEPGFIGLDSGSVYGRELTAYRLEDGAVVQVRGWKEGAYYSAR
jgi:bis(5'-nucleosyl)-tetraphosphatase (symmetrical)